MKEIKRYILNSHGLCDMCGMEELEENEIVATENYILEIDHKAVVEELEKENKELRCCGNCKNYNDKSGYNCCKINDDCHNKSLWTKK